MRISITSRLASSSSALAQSFLLAALAVLIVGLAPAAAQDLDLSGRFLLLATSRTGTMEEELNEAGAAGYRFVAAQGGETAFGGREAVVLMRRDPDGGAFRYILLATSSTETMHAELNGVPDDFELVGFTVFTSMFGGKEAAAILEAPALP